MEYTVIKTTSHRLTINTSESCQKLLDSRFCIERLVILLLYLPAAFPLNFTTLWWNWKRNHNFSKNSLKNELLVKRKILKVYINIRVFSTRSSRKHRDLLSCCTQLQKWCWTMDFILLENIYEASTWLIYFVIDNIIDNTIFQGELARTFLSMFVMISTGY